MPNECWPADVTHHRDRTDRVDKSGEITLATAASSTPSASAAPNARTRVTVLVRDLHIRIIDAATGELLRELVLGTTQRYQGTGRPPGSTR